MLQTSTSKREGGREGGRGERGTYPLMKQLLRERRVLLLQARNVTFCLQNRELIERGTLAPQLSLLGL